MTQETIIVGIISLLVGIIITYLLVKSSTVSREKFDTLKDNLAVTKNDLDTKIALEKELRDTTNQLHLKLNNEQETNKKQENNLAALNAKIQSLRERFLEEKETNKSQQKNIEKSNNRILDLKSELSKIETVKSSMEEKINQQSKEFEESHKKQVTEFENIANKLWL